MDNIAKLKWQCRRGMLELDVLLNTFLENHYQALMESDKTLFAELLNFSDQELYSWLLGYEMPADSRFVLLIDKIRKAKNN